MYEMNSSGRQQQQGKSQDVTLFGVGGGGGASSEAFEKGGKLVGVCRTKISY